VKETTVDQAEHRQKHLAGNGSWQSAIAVAGSVGGLLLLLDQLTKLAAARWLGSEATADHVDILGIAIGFEYVRNTGVAFGLLQGRQWLVSMLAILVLLAFLAAFWRDLPRHRALQLAVGAIVGGALGNLIDRFRLGYVVDFIAVGSFPRFNVADSSVTIGLVLMGWFLFHLEQPSISDKPDASRNDEHDVA
jgi:signal peptidase II